MAAAHARSGEIVALSASAAGTSPQTATLVKSDEWEVLRLVLPAGKELPAHRSAGEIVVQCVEGRTAFSSHGRTQDLTAGHLVFLAAGEPHALRAATDSILLVTRRRLQDGKAQPQTESG